MAIHQVSTKHTIIYVFILYGYTYVAPQDESCPCCYDLCRKLQLFSIRAIWYMCILYVYCSPNMQPMVPPKRFDIFLPDWGMLRRSRHAHSFLLKHRQISRVCEAYNSGYTPLFLFCIGLHCCFFCIIGQSTLPCLRVFFVCQFVPNLGFYLAPLISQTRCRHLERAIMIDHLKKHKNTQLSLCPHSNWLEKLYHEYGVRQSRR